MLELQPDLEHPLTGPFWRASAQQQLAIPGCEQCDRLVWYPREACSHCGAGLYWRTLSGRGTLAAFSVVKRPLFPAFAAFSPYVCALVALEEDPAVRLVSQVVDCDTSQLACDMPLSVVFRELAPDGCKPYLAPLFKPC
ncbi:Zn-ribbon domain-containing OB-fold protein [Parahaliea aestuarii]|uniref:Nucleic acid-binding protein n=1 Tax=Parahaliea aestuarii TaxID=1852021 RepID=A0A5C8ZWA2_9GAMM|nr:OB-fold domain-containing protein [Parahaliea aestuarii]TXS91747.1 nucleic acid-binding protein [Parahaliea aestuarii]